MLSRAIILMVSGAWLVVAIGGSQIAPGSWWLTDGILRLMLGHGQLHNSSRQLSGRLLCNIAVQFTYTVWGFGSGRRQVTVYANCTGKVQPFPPVLGLSEFGYKQTKHGHMRVETVFEHKIPLFNGSVSVSGVAGWGRDACGLGAGGGAVLGTGEGGCCAGPNMNGVDPPKLLGSILYVNSKGLWARWFFIDHP